MLLNASPVLEGDWDVGEGGQGVARHCGGQLDGDRILVLLPYFFFSEPVFSLQCISVSRDGEAEGKGFRKKTWRQETWQVTCFYAPRLAPILHALPPPPPVRQHQNGLPP